MQGAHSTNLYGYIAARKEKLMQEGQKAKKEEDTRRSSMEIADSSFRSTISRTSGIDTETKPSSVHVEKSRMSIISDKRHKRFEEPDTAVPSRPQTPFKTHNYSMSSAEQPRNEFMRPHPADVAREGPIWHMIGTNWQKQYGVITYNDKKPVLHIYHDDMAKKPSRLIDLSLCTKVAPLEVSAHYRSVHEFKLCMGNYDILLGCDSREDVRAWVVAIHMIISKPNGNQNLRETNTSAISSAPGNAERPKMPPAFETAFAELREFLDMKMETVSEIIGCDLPKTIINEIFTQTNHINLIRQIQNLEETVLRVVEHGNSGKDGYTIPSEFNGFSELSRSIQEICQSQSKVETLLGTAISKTGNPEIIQEIHNSVDSIKLSLSENRDNHEKVLDATIKRLDKLGKKVDIQSETSEKQLNALERITTQETKKIQDLLFESDQKVDDHHDALSESLLKIQSLLQAIKNSVAGSQVADKLETTVDEILSRVSLLSSRSSNGILSSPERPNSNMILNINEKLTSLNALFESTRESQIARLNGIEEKLRTLVISKNQRDPNEKDDRLVVLCNEINASLLEMDSKFGRMGKDSKGNMDVMHTWFNRLYEAVKTHQKQILEVHTKTDNSLLLENMSDKIEETLRRVTELGENSDCESKSSNDIKSYMRSFFEKSDQKNVAKFEDIQRSLAQIQNAIFPLTSDTQYFKTDDANSRKLDEILTLLNQKTSKIREDSSNTGLTIKSNDIGRQILSYHEEITRRDMSTAQVLDSIQHTLSRLVDSLDDGAVISKKSSSSSKQSFFIDKSQTINPELLEMKEMIKEMHAFTKKPLNSNQSQRSDELTNNIKELEARKLKLEKEVAILEFRKAQLTKESVVTGDRDIEEQVELESKAKKKNIAGFKGVMQRAASTSSLPDVSSIGNLLLAGFGKPPK